MTSVRHAIPDGTLLTVGEEVVESECCDKVTLAVLAWYLDVGGAVLAQAVLVHRIVKRLYYMILLPLV